MARNWKNVQPNSLTSALRLCKDYAIERKHLSVERIADLMGVTHDALYKWLSTGRMPAMLIPTYEHACGTQFVSRWLAASSGKLIIDIPTGRCATSKDVQALQGDVHAAVGALMSFYNNSADAETTLAAIQTAMEGLAFHRENVKSHDTPQLELGVSDDE